MKEETNKFKRAWIWLWYNDITRLCVLTGLPTIFVTAVIGLIFGLGEYLRGVAAATYIILFLWALADNDYSNLHRIGLTVYRKKMKHKQ